MKRSISLLLALILLFGALSSLTSCGDNSPVVIRYKDLTITQNEFIYELALEKTAYLSENKISADEESVWTKKTLSGITVDQACMNGLLRSEILKLYFASYAVEKGYDLTASEEELIDKSMNDYVGNFVDRKSFDIYMSNFSVGYDQIKKLMRLQYLSQKGQALLFGEGQSEEVTEADAVSFFNKNYVTVKHVYVNNVNKTYPNNKTVPLTESEKAEKNAKIAELQGKISSESFSSYLNRSEDGFAKEGATAITFCKGSYPEAYEKAAFEANVGQVVKAECPDGVYFICREPLNAEILTDDMKKQLMTQLTEEALTRIYEGAKSEAVTDHEILNLYSFASALYFTTFEPK